MTKSQYINDIHAKNMNDIHAGWLMTEQYRNRAPITCGISYINEYFSDDGNIYGSCK